MGVTTSGVAARGPYVPADDEVVGYLKANAVMGRTERFGYLDRREAHFKGLQYEHQQQDWWGHPADSTETISPRVTLPAGFQWATPQAEMPVRMKRPTAPLNLARAIITRFTGMLFSAARKPQIVVEDDPDDEDWLRTVAEESKFWGQMRSARNMGGSTGAVMVTVHVREGKFAYEVHNPKHLTILWEDRRTWRPRGVLKMYTYPVEVDDIDPKTGARKGTKIVDYLYRRIITTEIDVVFRPVRADGTEAITWEPDPELAVRHDVGTFPGVWIQNKPDPEEMDGDADCEGAWGMLDTLDRLVAQMNKGVLANLDPTVWLKYDPLEIKQLGEVRKGSDNSLNLGTKGEAGYLEITGAGIEIGLKKASFLKGAILDLTRCVLIDPDKISGSAQSAKAMEYLYAPMLEQCDDFRDQYGEGAVMLLKITARIGRKFQGQTIDLGTNPVTGDRQIGSVEFDLPPKVTKQPDGTVLRTPRKLGMGGNPKLKWGAYFAPTETDDQQRITNAVAAKTGGLISGVTATKHVQEVFEIADPEAEYERADGEEKDREASAMASLDAGVGGMPAMLPPRQGGAGGGHEDLGAPAPKPAGFGGRP